MVIKSSINYSWMKLGIILLVVLTSFLAASQFCSVMCGTCSGISKTSCTTCRNSNWIFSGGSCSTNIANGYYIAGSTPDIGEGTTMTVSPWGALAVNCNPFNTYGTYENDVVRVRLIGGIAAPFFQLTAYFGVIALDAGSGGGTWNSNTFYTVTMSMGAFVQTNYFKLYSGITDRHYCSDSSKKQVWKRITQSYNYNISNNLINFDISQNETDITKSWLLKEFILVYRTCNWKCVTCYGGLATQCTSCLNNGTYTMWQSNNTCNETCLTGFGARTTPNVCVFCDLHCTACFETATNCSACTRSGTFRAYFYTINSSCLKTCPDGFFANRTTQTCDPCNVNCTSCINTANYCTACMAYFGYYNHVCYSPCPIGFYNNTNGTNCTPCSPYCYICVDPYDLCTVCTTTSPYIAYLYNTTNATGQCVRTCPISYFPETFSGAGPNLCLPCNATCLYCTGSPTPCTACQPGYYLFNSTCINPCPEGYFPYNYSNTGACLDCANNCVDLEIQMYFPNALKQRIYIDMVFSQRLNFAVFDYVNFQDITITSTEMKYDMSMFTVSYEIKNQAFYRIILEPVSYIFLYNATFTVTTRSTANLTSDQSTVFMPFKSTNYAKSASLTWFLIKGPPLSTLEQNIMQSFATLSSKTNDFLSKPYVQEIKKSGVFNLLFSGAQVTSLSVLSNQIQSQNLYEGVRFWGVFVFFDVPPYESISNQTKHFFDPSVEDQIRNAQEEATGSSRRLFSTNSMYWRFQRTGQTSFFIYDCFMPVLLIMLCWVSLIIVCKCKNKHWYTQHASKIYSATHKIHEISIFYITMASIVEFLYFETTSTQRYVSAGICIFFNIYFVLYELYIYYDMLKYPLAKIGNRLYDYYVIRYGCFLKNIRFEEYDINEKWSPRHWFRPYNFHFLSYYKKYLMIITLPLFYSSSFAQLTILLLIQVLELIRVWVVWPFLSRRRNFFRFSLDLALAFFFLCNIIQIKLVQQIQSGDINSMGDLIKLFYGFGWAGFVFCFYFNLSHVVIGVYDLCVGLKISNRQKMDAARKKYYYGKIKDYQKDNEGASKDIVNHWLKLGNLNDNYFGELPEINVRIEEYIMRVVLGKFEVTVRKITELKMMAKRNHKKRNNTVTRKKIEKKDYLVHHVNPQLYSILHAVYQQFASNHVETVVLKTFLNVFQPDFAEDEEVPMDRNRMFQRVELISYDNEKQERQLEEMIQGFPLPAHLFERF